MSELERLIKIQGNQIFVTEALGIGLTKTNLPAQSFTFKSQPFFWTIKLEEFDRNTGKLLIEVVDYYPIHTEAFSNQQLRREIGEIEFRPLEWAYLEPFLSTYRKSELMPFIIDSTDIIVPYQTPHQYDLNVKVHLDDLNFHMGYLAFYCYLPMLGEEREIRIYNEIIRPEFALIKSVFSKMLKRKTYDAEITVKMQGHQLIRIDCYSPQLKKIDDQMIDTIRHVKIMNLTKNPIIRTLDKSLFTANQIFDATNDDQIAEVFNIGILDIIRTMSDLRSVRNRKQLQYLAGFKHSGETKIFITLPPDFGFIFTIEGESMFHICWELLNSHATYLWSFPKENAHLPYIIGRIEQTISSIRNQGRERYKQAYRVGEVDDDLLFDTIVHRSANSKLKDHFPEWRQRLEEKLV